MLYLLRVQVFGQAGKAHQVGEQDRDDPAFLVDLDLRRTAR